MHVRLGMLKLGAPLLLAGCLPLYAQFTTAGCPEGPSGPQLNGFTAGTIGSSQICLTGSFLTTAAYNVGLFSPIRNTTITGIFPQGPGLIVVTVPASFYATVSTPGQADPVTLTLVGPGFNQSGTFQVNPPLQGGGPVFVSAVGTAVGYEMYSGGTPPYQNQFSTGVIPPGMASFPLSSPTWTGTPSQSGSYTFSISATDGWNNTVTPTLAAYVVPIPQVTAIVPTTTTVGNASFTLTVTGTGFLSPTFVDSVPEPGSTVQVTGPGSSVLTLTPTNYLATQLTVTVPAGAFTSTGSATVVVANPSVTGTVSQVLTVTPSVTNLTPSTRTVGTLPFTLTVTGTGFVNGSVVRMSGAPLPTTYVNSTTLTATFPTVTKTGAYLITVINPDQTASPALSGEVVTVVAAPAISALSPSSVNAGGPGFSLQVVGSGFTSSMTVYFNSYPVSTVLVGAQANVQLVGSIPAAFIATAGTVPVWVTTADGYTTPSLQFTIVSTIPPLQFSNVQQLPSGVVNTPYSAGFTASGGTGPYSFSLQSGTLPAGLTLSPGGQISGTPTAIGTSRFIVQLADSASNTVALNFSITIAASPLLLTTPALSNTTQNTALSVQFSGSGGVPPYSFVEFGTLPPGVTLSSAGLLSGTPTQAGTYSFLVYIDDSKGASASGRYSLLVAPPGLLITPPSPLPAGQLAVPYTTQLAATGGAGAPYIWSATGLPAGLTIANNSGLIAGIPQAAGNFTIAVTILDHNGLTITQNYTLTIASSKLTFVTTALPNGAVGNSYSAGLAASGGSGIYTFTATGLPGGLTLTPAGTLSGTPTTAGTFTIGVTSTDSQGSTATASFPVTITSQVVVTGATISVVVGTSIPGIKLSATGGTPPYQWQTGSAPPGLSLGADGTLSGTPTTVGSFQFLVYAVDSNGALANGTVNVTVGLPGAPKVTLTGLPASNAPATQPAVQVTLGSAYPAAVTATLTLTFAPASGVDDPSVQFASGGRTAQVTVPAGTTVGLSTVGLQTGTVAGTITITAQLSSGTQNVTPTPAPSVSIQVNATVPVITSITATRNSTGFTVVLVGYSSSRDLATAAYQFTGAAGSNLLNTQASTAVGTLFTQWYGSAAAAPYGSQFTLTQPFTVTGSPASVLSVTVTLTNSVGTSQAVSANLQ